jgi:hypothetical protein
VNLRLLSQAREELPGRLYGKVIAIQAAQGGHHEATIRFTSLSADAATTIKAIIS